MLLRTSLLCCLLLQLTLLSAQGPAFIVCNNQVNAAINTGNCLAEIGPEHLLASDYSAYDFSMLPAGPFEGGDYVVTVTVGTGADAKSCMVNLQVTDYSIPTVTCRNRTITVADRATIDYDDLVDELTTTNGGCAFASWVNYNFYSSWTAYTKHVDNFNNDRTASCTGYIIIRDGEPQTYCNASGNTTYEHIRRVQFHGVGANVDRVSGRDPGGYHYQPAYNSTRLMRYMNYIMTFTPGFSGGAYQEHWAVFLDLNRDGDFTDAGETLHRWNGYGAHSFSFQIPAGISYGYSRLRVAMRYGSPPSSCGSMSYGEVEEYSVELSPFIWNGLNTVVADEPLAAADAPEIPRASEREIAMREQEMGLSPLPVTVAPVESGAVAVYPNPVARGNQLGIKTDQPLESMRLSNLLGRTVLEIQQPTEQQGMSIPSDLPAGMYLLTGFVDGGKVAWSRRLRIR